MNKERKIKIYLETQAYNNYIYTIFKMLLYKFIVFFFFFSHEY